MSKEDGEIDIDGATVNGQAYTFPVSLSNDFVEVKIKVNNKDDVVLDEKLYRSSYKLSRETLVTMFGDKQKLCSTGVIAAPAPCLTVGKKRPVALCGEAFFEYDGDKIAAFPLEGKATCINSGVDKTDPGAKVVKVTAEDKSTSNKYEARLDNGGWAQVVMAHVGRTEYALDVVSEVAHIEKHPGANPSDAFKPLTPIPAGVDLHDMGAVRQYCNHAPNVFVRRLFKAKAAVKARTERPFSIDDATCKALPDLKSGVNLMAIPITANKDVEKSDKGVVEITGLTLTHDVEFFAHPLADSQLYVEAPFRRSQVVKARELAEMFGKQYGDDAMNAVCRPDAEIDAACLTVGKLVAMSATSYVKTNPARTDYDSKADGRPACDVDVEAVSKHLPPVNGQPWTAVASIQKNGEVTSRALVLEGDECEIRIKNKCTPEVLMGMRLPEAPGAALEAKAIRGVNAVMELDTKPETLALLLTGARGLGLGWWKTNCEKHDLKKGGTQIPADALKAVLREVRDKAGIKEFASELTTASDDGLFRACASLLSKTGKSTLDNAKATLTKHLFANEFSKAYGRTMVSAELQEFYHMMAEDMLQSAAPNLEVMSRLAKFFETINSQS